MNLAHTQIKNQWHAWTLPWTFSYSNTSSSIVHRPYHIDDDLFIYSYTYFSMFHVDSICLLFPSNKIFLLFFIYFVSFRYFVSIENCKRRWKHTFENWIHPIWLNRRIFIDIIHPFCMEYEGWSMGRWKCVPFLHISQLTRHCSMSDVCMEVGVNSVSIHTILHGLQNRFNIHGPLEESIRNRNQLNIFA